MADPTKQEVRGLRLDQYAGICAILSNGFPLPAALEIEGLDEKRWLRAGPAWAAKLAGQGPDAPLRRAYAQKLAEADAWLGRQIKPLDEDLESWLGFLGAWSGDPAPQAFLSRLKVSAADVTRLQRGWAQRLATDQTLRKRVLALAAKRPSRLPSIRIVHASLRPFPWSSSRARQVAHGRPRAGVAMVEPTAGPGPVVLATPSFLLHRAPPAPPPSSRRPASTTLAFALPGRPALPFKPAVPAPPLPVPELTMEQHASLTAELARFPARAADVLRRYGVTEQARTRLDQHYAGLGASCPDARAAWQRAYRTYHEWLSSNLCA